MMTYLKSQYEDRYKILIKKSCLNYKDRDRETLFYIITQNNDLYKQLNKIYNFQE